jgi:Cu(I)/Ag(I) efflux system periplasmic protein CusF
MKRLALTVAALGLASSLAACSKKETASTEATAPPAAPAAAPAPAPASGGSNMSGMGMSSDAKMAKGTGTVTAVSADSVTIDHGPIPEADWPAMTMAFKASPDIAKQVKAGDKVTFDLKLQGGAGEVTAIKKQ